MLCYYLQLYKKKSVQLKTIKVYQLELIYQNLVSYWTVLEVVNRLKITVYQINKTERLEENKTLRLVSA